MKAPILKDIETFIYMIVIITVFHLSNLTQQIVTFRFVSERLALITRQLNTMVPLTAFGYSHHCQFKHDIHRKNIINVAISRARDTLIVVMPNDQTENVEHLTRVKNVEHLMHASGDFIEYASQDIEQLMFGSRTYIEDNTFSTSHQSVNVYGLPETYYEIRSEDHALDVQIHKQNQQRPLAQSSSASANESTELTANVHGTKKISSGLRMKIAPDGWDQLEITLLVQFFLTLSKMDSGQLDQATKTFCDELQAYAARLHPGDRNAIAERSYDAVGSRIAGLNVLRLGASADEAGLPKLYEHVYHMSQAYPNAFRSWLHTAEKACPITW